MPVWLLQTLLRLVYASERANLSRQIEVLLLLTSIHLSFFRQLLF